MPEQNKITPLISRDLVDVFLRDINKRKDEGISSLKKYALELEKQMEKEEPNIVYSIDEILKNLSIKDENSFLSGFRLCYDLFRRKIGTENLESEIKF